MVAEIHVMHGGTRMLCHQGFQNAAEYERERRRVMRRLRAGRASRTSPAGLAV